MNAEIRAILDSVRAIERESGEQPDEIVVSPAVWDALRAQNTLRYNAQADGDYVAGLRVSMTPIAKGVAFFRDGKLIKVVL